MAIDTATTERRVRWERVDQLRGLAALAVVVCHLSVSAYLDVPNADGGRWPWLAMLLGFGYLGVPLFFVISGFCIHLPYARGLARDDGAGAPDWRRFFARRFWRLYPPYLAALVIALGLWWATGEPVPWPAVTTQALLVHPFHTATFDGVNPPAWTLAVEAQLYVAYPIVFWLTARAGALRALGAVLAITMAYRLALVVMPPLPAELAGPAWAVFLARWFEWTLGATVAEWAAGRLVLPRALGSPWVGLGALGAAVAVEWCAGSFGLYLVKEPLYGVAFALLLHAALLREPAGASSALGRYLAGIGLYSYSLYLLHRPIQLALEPLARWVASWPVVIALGLPSSLAIMAASTPLVLWASRAFYRRFEEPAIERARSV